MVVKKSVMTCCVSVYGRSNEKGIIFSSVLPFFISPVVILMILCCCTVAKVHWNRIKMEEGQGHTEESKEKMRKTIGLRIQRRVIGTKVTRLLLNKKIKAARVMADEHAALFASREKL